MTQLIAFFLRQSVFLNVSFVGLVCFAAFVAIPRLPIERYPNISFAQGQVTTPYPGAKASDVEREVTRPIEDAIRGMEEVEFVSSVSVHGQSEILVKFIDDRDYDALYDELRFRVLSAQNQLPVVNGDPLQPRFEEIDTDAWLPVVQVNLLTVREEGTVQRDSEEARRLLVRLGRDLRDRLERIEGVKRIDVLGDVAQQFVVSVDPERLARFRVAFDEVVRAIRESGGHQPAGTVDTELGERTIRVDARYRERQDLLDVVVRREGDGAVLTVLDLVDLESTGIRRIDSVSLNSVNGRPAVSLKVLKERQASSLDLWEIIRGEVTEWETQMAAEPIEVIYTLDSTTRIEDSMAVLYDSFLLATALVVATLFFFLTRRGRRHAFVTAALCLVAIIVIASTQEKLWEMVALGALSLFVFATCRSAVLTVSGLVFSFLGTLVVFQIAGQSLNEVTLLGFVLTVGIIVDDAIIVVENVQRHREHGKRAWRAIVDGTAEVFWPVVSATLTTCAAFLPMLIMTGTTGDFFALLPISVATALAISLVECLIVLPLHIYDLERWFGTEPHLREVEETSSSADRDLELLLARPGFVGRLARAYDRILLWNLHHPRVVVAGCALAFLLVIGVIYQSVNAPQLGQSPILKLVFFPEDTSVLNVSVRLPSGSTLDDTNEVVERLSERLLARGPGEIASCSGLAGLNVDASYRPVWSRQYGFIFVELPSRDVQTFDSADRLIASIREDIGPFCEERGIELEVRAQKDGPPTGAPVSIRIMGSDAASIARLADDLHAFLVEESAPNRSLEGVIELNRDDRWRTREIEFVPDPRRVAQYGYTISDVQQFVAGAFDGAYGGDCLRVDDEIPVRVRVERDLLRAPHRVMEVPLREDPSYGMVRFSDLGRMATSVDPASLRRRDYQRTVTVTGNLDSSSPLSAGHINAAVEEWYRGRESSYVGASLEFGGEAEHTEKSLRSLFVAFGLAIFLIYLVLAAQFRSYSQPLIILSNVMFSFAGVMFALAAFSIGASLLPEGAIRPERAWITVSSFIAVVGLTGIVVNDAIVLIDFINRHRRDGGGALRAAHLAGHQRMRPILMTTISTIAGLVPMAIGIPHFSIAWSPFATCFVTGLIVATGMTLLVVPVLYVLIARDSEGDPDPIVEPRATE